jgi:hypothetical protein
MEWISHRFKTKVFVFRILGKDALEIIQKKILKNSRENIDLCLRIYRKAKNSHKDKKVNLTFKKKKFPVQIFVKKSMEKICTIVGSIPRQRDFVEMCE